MSRFLTRRRVITGGFGAAALGVGAGMYALGRTPVSLSAGTSRARPVPDTDTLPAAVDVVIIGGGFVGTVAALTLAERGISVALCEKGVIAGEASGRSMGYVDSQFLSPLKMELVARAKHLWAGMNERTGLDTGFRPTGLVAALGSAEQEAGAEAWAAGIRGMLPGPEPKVIKGDQIRQLFPGMLDPLQSALYTAGDASCEPQLAAPAIAEAARQKGAKVLQNCAVRGIETKAGRVSGVVTEKGPITCQSILLAGGAWTPLFANSLGISIPQLDVHLSMMGLSEVPGVETPLSTESYGIRRQTTGGFTFGVVNFAAPLQPATLRNVLRLKPAIEYFWPITHVGLAPADFIRQLTASSTWPLDQPSPFEERRIIVPAFRAGPLEEGLADLRRHFPTFKNATIRERWAGVISSLPDNMPIISAVSAYPGLYIGSGFTYGLTMGPAAGEALADLATGQKPQFNLHNYRLERFSDGSSLEFQT